MTSLIQSSAQPKVAEADKVYVAPAATVVPSERVKAFVAVKVADAVVLGL